MLISWTLTFDRSNKGRDAQNTKEIKMDLLDHLLEWIISRAFSFYFKINYAGNHSFCVNSCRNKFYMHSVAFYTKDTYEFEI